MTYDCTFSIELVTYICPGTWNI